MGNNDHKKAGFRSALVKDSTIGQAVAGCLPNSRMGRWVRERRDHSGLFFAPLTTRKQLQGQRF